MDGNSKLIFGYDVLVDLEKLLAGILADDFDGHIHQMNSCTFQILENWFGICAAIVGFLAEYFRDVFRISNMEDNEIEIIVIIAM